MLILKKCIATFAKWIGCELEQSAPHRVDPMNVDDHIRLSLELGDDVIFVPIFVNLASPTHIVLR